MTEYRIDYLQWSRNINVAEIGHVIAPFPFAADTFNGAATLTSRKSGIRYQTGLRICLQWSRNINVAEIRRARC